MIKEHAQRESDRGKRVSIGNKKLIVEGEYLNWNEEEEILAKAKHGND